jgi:arylsulfatase A-like enzyme
MKRTVVIVCALLGCHRAPPAPSQSPETTAKPAATTRPPATTRGDRLAYRFVDHAGDAVVTGPDLAAAWRALPYPAKIVSPYSGLRGDAAARVVELALADADVASYGRPRARSQASSRKLAFDAVWNRTRAVYESKTSLLAAGGTSYTFDLPPVTDGELRFDAAVPPDGLPVELSVEADGKSVWTHTLDKSERGLWLHATLPLRGAKRIRFACSGDPAAVALFGEPTLVEHAAEVPAINVVLIVIDTLRRDALPVMPRLGALVARSASFDQAITAATWTRPSVLAMLGGDLPTAIGQSAEEMIPSDGERRRFYAIAPPLLPRVLEGAGYLASAIGNNFFLLGYPQIGLALGFDEVADIRHPVLDTPAITAAAVAYLQAHTREPFFLHLHYDAPHWPYTPPSAYLSKVAAPPGFPVDSMARAYLAEARYADDYVGQVLDELTRLGLDKRTLVVIVGDHGEIFDHAHDHVVEALGQPTLHHHGWSAYDELLRVPLVVSLPGTIPPIRVDRQVSLIDVEPTVLDVLGLPARPGARGRSLAPLWRGERVPERPAFVEGQDVRALRADGWLYLRRSDPRLVLPDGSKVRVEEELYELATDPLQHRNRVGDAPDRLASMRARFDKEAPSLRDAPVSVLHLRTAPDAQPHLVDGVIRSDGALSIRAVGGAEASPVDAHAVRLTMRGAALVDLVVDPPTAGLELSFRRDGTPLKPRQLLLGRFALPLLGSETSAVLEGERLTWLDAEREPVLGDRGEVILWRDPSAITPVAPSQAGSNSEVAGMMRRWGYAQPAR